jgi:hypothetical protein
VRLDAGNLSDRVKLSSQDSASTSSNCDDFPNSSMSCLNDTDRPSEPERSILKNPSLFCPWEMAFESSLDVN